MKKKTVSKSSAIVAASSLAARAGHTGLQAQGRTADRCYGISPPCARPCAPATAHLWLVAVNSLNVFFGGVIQMIYSGSNTAARRAQMSSRNTGGTEQTAEKGRARQSMERSCESSSVP